MSTVLSVNLNKIALLRNSRVGDYPSVIAFGEKAIAAGALGLTVHPRPDLRHIKPADVFALKKLCSQHQNVEFNIEGNPFSTPQKSYSGFCQLVTEAAPQQCTLVPDSTEQLTSDHGFNLTQTGEKLAPIIAAFKKQGIRVSLFMDPDIEQIKLAKAIGADRIELYTGPFAEAFSQQQGDDTEHLNALFQRYFDASIAAHELGLGINAGHDLNLNNLSRFLEIPNILEVSIGHALTMDALDMGFEPAVRAYQALCSNNKA